MGEPLLYQYFGFSEFREFSYLLDVFIWIVYWAQTNIPSRFMWHRSLKVAMETLTTSNLCLVWCRASPALLTSGHRRFCHMDMCMYVHKCVTPLSVLSRDVQMIPKLQSLFPSSEAHCFIVSLCRSLYQMKKNTWSMTSKASNVTNCFIKASFSLIVLKDLLLNYVIDTLMGSEERRNMYTRKT